MTDPKTYLFREYGVKYKDRFNRNFILRDEHVKDFTDRFENTDVFYCIYRSCSTNRAESLLYGEFYMDIDSKDASTSIESFEKVRDDSLKCIKFLIGIVKVPEENIKIYFSGNKGIHITVEPEALGIEPCDNLNVIYKLMAEDVMQFTTHKLVDMQVYDTRRLFRIPNSRNGATKLYKVRISYEELTKLTLKEIVLIAKKNRKFNEVNINANNISAKNNMVMYRNRALLSKRNTYKEVTRKLESTPPCISYLLSHQVIEGQRNNTSIAVASFFKQKGYNIEEAESLLMNWGLEHCDPPLLEREIRTTLRQAYEGNYKYGCNKLRLLAECDAKNCELKG